jgi:pimeloyl-ACP methyl ester carboxylesterase
MLSSPLINAFHWRKLLPELSELGCLCAVVDMPGFGLSDPGAPQGDTMRANLIWGILDDVDNAAGAPMSMWHLAAHGCASRVILRMAALYPDSVKSQIHLAPTLSVRTGGKKAVDPLRWYDGNVRDAGRFRRMIEHYAAYPMDDYIVDRMRRPLLRPGVREAMDSYLRRAATAPGLGAGFCPTMVIYGGRDPLLDETRTRQMHDLLQGAEYHRLANAGHFPTETHSRAIRDYLRGWLRYND